MERPDDQLEALTTELFEAYVDAQRPNGFEPNGSKLFRTSNRDLMSYCEGSARLTQKELLAVISRDPRLQEQLKATRYRDGTDLGLMVLSPLQYFGNAPDIVVNGTGLRMTGEWNSKRGEILSRTHDAFLKLNDARNLAATFEDAGHHLDSGILCRTDDGFQLVPVQNPGQVHTLSQNLEHGLKPMLFRGFYLYRPESGFSRYADGAWDLWKRTENQNGPSPATLGFHRDDAAHLARLTTVGVGSEVRGKAHFIYGLPDQTLNPSERAELIENAKRTAPNAALNWQEVREMKERSEERNGQGWKYLRGENNKELELTGWVI